LIDELKGIIYQLIKTTLVCQFIMQQETYLPKHIREENARKAAITYQEYFIIQSANYNKHDAVLEFYLKTCLDYETSQLYLLKLACPNQETFDKLKPDLDQTKEWLILYKGDKFIQSMLPHTPSPSLCTII